MTRRSFLTLLVAAYLSLFFRPAPQETTTPGMAIPLAVPISIGPNPARPAPSLITTLLRVFFPFMGK